ncbi:ead/Ea22-like family protein [Azotobacter salinestris]|uniref:ead/Ea22-like family protein n=1 Tax=Azotobacter salinestris TaxID=69964 RepID=UPI00142F1A0D|nr:ead/Ea22-like family protein [Azotobacter salinestris]
MADIENLKRLAEAATPGPWSVGDANRDERDIGIHGVGEGSIVADVCVDVWGDPDANADFIAAANPAAILELIAENEALKARLEVDDRHPYDGIACRDETIKGLQEQADRLKAELERARADVNFFNQQCRREKLTCMQLQAENERLQEQQKSAGDADAAENCRCNEKVQVVQELQAELERVKAEGLALLVMARPFLASRLTELPSIREQVENPEAVDRAIEKLSALVSHIDAALGKGGGQSGTKTAETRASAGLDGGGHGGNSGGAENALETVETREIDGAEGGAEKGGKADD